MLRAGGVLTELTYEIWLRRGKKKKKHILNETKGIGNFEKKKTYGIGLTELKVWVFSRRKRAYSSKPSKNPKLFARKKSFKFLQRHSLPILRFGAKVTSSQNLF